MSVRLWPFSKLILYICPLDEITPMTVEVTTHYEEEGENQQVNSGWAVIQVFVKIPNSLVPY